MTGLLVYLIVLVLIFGILFWAIDMLPLPPPFHMVVRVLLVLVLVLILVDILMGGRWVGLRLGP